MTDKARPTIWLVDVATGQQRAARSPAPGPIRPRAGRPTAAASPMFGRRGRQRRSCTCAGWRAATARASPAFPTAPTASPGRPTAAASLIRCSSRTRAHSSAPRRPSLTARNGPSRCRSSTRSPTAPTAPAISSPATTRSSWSPADGGAPRQLTFGAINAGGPVAWTARRPRGPVQRQPHQNWERDAQRERNLSRRHRRRRASRADQPARGPTVARSVARRTADRLCRLRRRRPRLSSNAKLYGDERGRLEHAALLTGKPRPHVGNPAWAADGRSIYVQYDEHGSDQRRPRRSRRLGPPMSRRA